jgi:dolichol-phosphate mannosyltransferase
MNKKLVSIVCPVYNEEENVNNFYKSITAVTDKLETYDFEFIFTDNHSEDSTYELLDALASKDSRLRVFRFSKNFGFQKSILTGYRKARGAAAIEFDADCQDPPELLSDFLREWEKGYQIVYGIRKERKEGLLVTVLRKLFYRLINKISDHNHLPHDAGDFMLIDAAVLEQLRQVDDQNPYLRGIIFGFGFKQKGIEYKRNARQYGKSKFPFFKMLSLAVDGIVSQSTLPLRLSSYLGIAISIMALLLAFTYVLIKIFFNDYINIPTGFTTLAFLGLLSIGINAMFLGIIGEYLARTYSQTKKYPLTIIERKIDNF